MVSFPAVPSQEGKLCLLLDMSLQSITLSCIAPLARPRKPVGGEIALDARSEPSAASFGLRLWKRRQMGLIRWEGRACRDRQKRTRQACPSRLQSSPFIAEAITSRREASSDSPCRAQAAPPDTKRLRRHERFRMFGRFRKFTSGILPFMNIPNLLNLLNMLNPKPFPTIFVLFMTA